MMDYMYKFCGSRREEEKVTRTCCSALFEQSILTKMASPVLFAFVPKILVCSAESFAPEYFATRNTKRSWR